MLRSLRRQLRPLANGVRALSGGGNVTPSGGRTQVAGARRFYEEVSVVPVVANPAPEGGDGRDDSGLWEIRLDGRLLRTPGRLALSLPTAALAHTIALEWDAQGGEGGVDPHSMPMMTIACTAIDNISTEAGESTTGFDKGTLVNQIMPFLDTDTCLFYDKTDRKLLRKQKGTWGPLVEWLAKTHDAPLKSNLDSSADSAIMWTPHPEASVANVRALLERMDMWTLTAINALALECKSLVIPLALHARHISVQQAVAAARLDEEDQIGRWGLVEGGHDIDRVNADVSVAATAVFLNFLGVQGTVQ